MIKFILILLVAASSELIIAQDGLGESSPACPAPNTDRSISGFQSALNVGESAPSGNTGNSDAVITDQAEPPSDN
jgi:hypothetical protein